MSFFSIELSAKIKWQLIRFFDQVGLLGRAALLLVFLLTVLFFIRWQALQNKINTMHLEVPGITKNTDAYVDQEKMLADALVKFPKVDDKAQTFNRLMQLANAQELTLDAVTYKTKHSESTAPLSQTMVDFTLIATYPEVHDFINKVMVSMPFVAIEQLSFTRINNEDDVIEARIKLLFNFVLN